MRALSSEQGEIGSVLVRSRLQLCDVHDFEEELVFLDSVINKVASSGHCVILEETVYSNDFPGEESDCSLLDLAQKEFIGNSDVERALQSVNDANSDFKAVVERNGLGQKAIEQLQRSYWLGTVSRFMMEGTTLWESIGQKENIDKLNILADKTQRQVEGASIAENAQLLGELLSGIPEESGQELIEVSIKWHLTKQAAYEVLVGARLEKIKLAYPDVGFQLNLNFENHKNKSFKIPQTNIYIRDEYLVFQERKSLKPIILRRYEPGVNMNMLEVPELKGNCISLGNTLEKPALDIEGGNLFVFDDIAFASKDELMVRYLGKQSKARGDNADDWKKRLAEIGISNPHLLEEHQLVKAVSRKVAEFLGVKSVIWVGLDSPIITALRKEPYYQPMYHIDLTFNMVRIEESDNGKTLVALVGIPHKDYTKVLCKDSTSIECERAALKSYKITKELELNIKRTVNNLQYDLALIGIDLKTIEIPLPLTFYETGGIDRVAPYVNGLFSNGMEGKKYFLPVNIDGINPGLEVVKTRLLMVFDEVIEIPAEYSRESGLRCRVVPLTRE